MAPRRQNYARSRSTSYNMPSYAPIPPPPPNQDLMPPSSRYLHNLRVIQRHDPSITSLFDQFPHVCVYHHKGDEWQKKGCEGAMFLFEREQEPKYGFYILNRNNTGDYIQRMTPDDDVEFASAYLIYRAYGKVTSDTIGLWTMVTQDREAMSQVMMRLHSYIKRNIRYPDEYRRRPDTWSTTPAPVHAQALPLPLKALSTQNSSSSSSMAALSSLLAKLDGSSEYLSNPSPPNRAISSSVPPPATGIPLLDSIFASASTSEVVSPSNPTPQTSQAASPGGDALHALFANGTAPIKAPSSASTSCGPTPTQHPSQLPDPPPPSGMKAKANGSSLGSSHSVFPPSTGKLPASVASWQPNGRKAGPGDITDRKISGQRLETLEQSRQDDEASWEEDESAGVSPRVIEGGVDPISVPRKNKTRKAKKRERERERRRMLKRGAAQNSDGDGGGAPGEERVEWPLVDDRSLSVDEEGDEEGSVGLGDGLLNALAAVSEPEMLNGQSPRPVLEHPTGSKKGRKERGKDRWKRKLRQKEEAMGGSQTSDAAGYPEPKFEPEGARGALLDAYGRRRRVGDNVLDEDALANEVVELIQNDPAFVRELYHQYLMRVQV